jgi:hypothetical protein
MNGARSSMLAALSVAAVSMNLVWPGQAWASDREGQQGTAAGTPPGLRPLAQRLDRATGSLLSSRAEPDGSTVSEMSVGPLQVTKTVRQTGEITIDLRHGEEPLRVEIAPRRLRVVAAGETIDFNPAKASERDYQRVKSVMGRSAALMPVRAVAAHLDDETLRSPEGLSFLITETILAVLDGDVAAPKRFRQRLSLTSPGAAEIVLARLDSCYTIWKAEVVQAFEWVEECYHDFPWWNVPARQLCFFEWTIRVEFAWAELLRCTALSPRLP